ncbi:MAG: type II toxin-antitoxin system HicA family toxin [Desulfovibrio sp.]|nr:type II toxin-antitoxin system HicA family toxin [Desulfovibrio sp.]
MPRMTPQHWKTLERVFLSAGFSFARQASSHRVYEKSGVLRPIIIPEYEEIDVEIIKRLIRTAGLTRDEYFRLLGDV